MRRFPSARVALIAACAVLTMRFAQEPPAVLASVLPSDAPPALPTTHPSQAAVLAADSAVHLDLPYGGPDATLDVLDIYAPKNAKGAAVMIFVHGGEWSRGDKKDISYKPAFFNEHGIVLVAPNYRLSPKDPHPAQVGDVTRSVAWVHEHIHEFGGDPQRIFIMGHSAGCHLVSYIMLNPEPLAKVGMKPADIRGAIAWSGGMYDLVARANGGGMYPPFINATFGTTPELQRAGSPMTYVQNAKNAPPMLIASVDDARSQTSREASDELVRQINANGGHATKALLVGKSHFTASHELGKPGDQSAAQLLAFIDGIDSAVK